MNYYSIQTSDSLEHHGIIGQKWGIRRYQNPDGSLTAEGKARISGDAITSIKEVNALQKTRQIGKITTGKTSDKVFTGATAAESLLVSAMTVVPYMVAGFLSGPIGAAIIATGTAVGVGASVGAKKLYNYGIGKANDKAAKRVDNLLKDLDAYGFNVEELAKDNTGYDRYGINWDKSKLKTNKKPLNNGYTK